MLPATMEDECVQQGPPASHRREATDFSIDAIIGRCHSNLKANVIHRKPSSPESAKPLPLNVFTFGKYFIQISVRWITIIGLVRK